MRIALTGPTGAIGSDTIRLAISKGHEVIAVVRPGTDRLGNLPKSDKIRIIESDISDYDKIDISEKCDIFIHLAWMNTFGNQRDDVYTQTANIQYSLDAVRLAHKWGSTSFIGVGSQAEYGIKNEKLNSSTPIDPQSGYGVAKYAAGKLCKILCEQLGMRFNWARILSTYGVYDAEHTLIMYLINTLLDGNIPELTKCEQKWDYIYSKDVATALLSIGSRGKNGKTYCVGSGECRELKDYVIELKNIVNPGSEIRFGARPYYAHQPMMLSADISELREDTGFVPAYTFAKGIQEILDHIKTSRKRDRSNTGLK